MVDVPSVVPSSRVSVEAPSHQAFLFSPFCLLNFLGCEMELKKEKIFVFARKVTRAPRILSCFSSGMFFSRPSSIFEESQTILFISFITAARGAFA